MNQNTLGHIVVLITILIWGLTFTSTKVLLNSFSPVEILFFRFVIGLAALSIAYPHRMKILERRHELYFAVAGLCGVSLYFLLENIALTYSTASNIGVLVAVTPFFTGILAYFFLGERLSLRFFIGFIVAITGITMISFNGAIVLQLNPLGDFLAILAAIIWAIYSIIIRKIVTWGYNSIQTTRRIFLYGLLLLVPVLYFYGFRLDLSRFLNPVNSFNIVFLGIGASAVCFATWSLGVKLLGASKASTYIYLNPVIAVLAAALILGERITPLAAAGSALTLVGVIISDGKFLQLFKHKIVDKI